MLKKKWYTPVRMIFPVIYGLLIFFGIIHKDFTLIIILFASSLLLGAFHCGWLCPFGYIQEGMGRLGRKLKLPQLKVPVKWEKLLRVIRYILLALSFAGLGFVYYLNTPYSTTTSLVSGYINGISWIAWSLLGLFLFLSLLVDRPFCRYFCTEGAQHGILSMARLFSIRRSKESCINCKACDRACPSQIVVSETKHIRNGQCINCFKCLEACPVEKTLTYGWAFKKDHKNKEEKNEK